MAKVFSEQISNSLFYNKEVGYFLLKDTDCHASGAKLNTLKCMVGSLATLDAKDQKDLIRLFPDHNLVFKEYRWIDIRPKLEYLLQLERSPLRIL